MASAVLSPLQAALRSGPGETVVAEAVSGDDVAAAIRMTHRSLRIAIPEDEWAVFPDRTAVAWADVLVRWAWSVSVPKRRKHPRGPQKPKPKNQRGPQIRHGGHREDSRSAP